MVELIAVKFMIWTSYIYNSDFYPPILIRDFPTMWKSKKLASNKLKITVPFYLVSIRIKSFPFTLNAVKMIRFIYISN